MRPLRLIAACVVALQASTGSSAGDAREAEAPRKTLLMHYMPWYQTPEVQGYWGGHWAGWKQEHDPAQADERGLPDIRSEFRPLIGTYDSADPDVIECHLLQMKLAGVDGVIVDWYGIADTADYPANQRGSVALFDACGDLGMSFAVCYEDRTIQHMENTGVLDPGAVQAHLTETIEWLDTNWFGDERYVQINGRPLLLNFGPIHIEDPTVWDIALGSVSPRPSFFALHHLWEGVNADGGYTWVHSYAWETPDPARIRRVLDRTYRRVSDDPSKTIVSAVPGFDDIYENSHPYVPHLGGMSMEVSLGVCMDGPWEIVQLVTWNDYGEGTMIEPTYEFGYRFLEIIQDARREEAGGSFEYNSDDLRLPAMLLEARRSGDVSRAEGDAVRRLILNGETDAAHRALGAVTP
jgi:hypothetical protein